MFFFYGCLFHWFSKMQRSVTLSSAEAEFFGAMLAAKEVIFIRELLIDLGFSIDGASVINCDSKSAVGMAFDPVAFKKTKHILRAAEFLRESRQPWRYLCRTPPRRRDARRPAHEGCLAGHLYWPDQAA